MNQAWSSPNISVLPGAITVVGVSTFSNTTDATSSIAAGVIMSGGLAVAKKINVGTNGTFGAKVTVNMATADWATIVNNTNATAASSFGLKINAGNDTGDTCLQLNNRSLAQLYSVDGLGNFVSGSGALATTATDGFFYIRTMAGTPTGNTTDFTGCLPMVFDTAASKLWVNTTGTTWKSVTLA